MYKRSDIVPDIVIVGDFSIPYPNLKSITKYNPPKSNHRISQMGLTDMCRIFYLVRNNHPVMLNDT